MFRQKVKYAMLAAAAAGALVVGVAGPANAVPVIIDGWNLNLSVATGVFAGLSNATNVDFVDVNGNSTVTQTLLGGVPINQPFTDTGTLQLADYHKEPTGSFTSSFGLPGNDVLYFKFTGLTGTFNPDGTLSFNTTASSPIQLILDNQGGSTETLANFNVVPPSGGSGFGVFFGGAGPNATVDISLQESSGIAGLFTNSLNQPLSLATTLHLVNVDALNDPTFNPNPAFSGGAPCNATTGGVGCTSAIVHVNNGGQYNLAVNVVPEPGTLSLLGGGLLLLGFAGSRRRKGS